MMVMGVRIRMASDRQLLLRVAGGDERKDEPSIELDTGEK